MISAYRRAAPMLQTRHSEPRSNPYAAYAGTVGVDEHGELDSVVGHVAGDERWIGEHDERDVGLGWEVVEAVAHGDHVVGTGQSMQVAMEDEYHRAPAVLAQTPAAAVGGGEIDLGGGLADPDHPPIMIGAR